MKRSADGGDGHGSGKRYGKGGTSGAHDKGVPKSRHAFKVLISEGLAAGLLGTRGVMKEEIQNETGSKLVFSNRGDYFPGSGFRVLGIYADEPSCIQRAFEWILPKLVDLGDEERKNPPKDGPELLGKEPGEYVFRFCVTRRMSSHIIGTGGNNIKQIRNDTGAKVFIENDNHLGHRLVRVIGTPEQILPALERLNEFVQTECDDQDFFSGFAGIVNFGEASASGWTPPPEPWPPSGPSGGKGGDGGGDSSREGRGVLVPPPVRGSDAGDDGSEPRTGSVQEEVDSLADVLSSFPPGTPHLQYSVCCDLPKSMVGVVVGRSGENIKYVEQATNTTIDIDNEDSGEAAEAVRPMTIVGQLVNVYTAHAMMLLKLRATEAKDREEAEREAQRKAIEQSEDPDILKARIQELQAQLAAVAGKA
mmetsp:Transcript_91012/g.241721  ORF Transcript_91012/g.241721 Transcript_91012/m.241721 type:complete len:420 (-) Transcript_91012:42-1301(-)|eukprot:CAMPEP_0171174162 /NCGR_PEP_ID=MMETSP0790-20130122/10587_1 /TAXON_ID=2925 /ORGANISM="Alexandrium catenella, Strain OF101" /LENGTH=419 /DNA_ID=CAMNT_0011639031 /DNA_START=139 /DNA_END=1398 /DNA_ORIENTATION=+